MSFLRSMPRSLHIATTSLARSNFTVATPLLQKTKRDIHNITLPIHSEDTVYSPSTAQRQVQLEIQRLRQSVAEKDILIEELKSQLMQKGEVVKKEEMMQKGERRVETGRRADKMMELLVGMSARERGAYDPL
jgi:hypothetical protein